MYLPFEDPSCGATLSPSLNRWSTDSSIAVLFLRNFSDCEELAWWLGICPPDDKWKLAKLFDISTMLGLLPFSADLPLDWWGWPAAEEKIYRNQKKKICIYWFFRKKEVYAWWNDIAKFCYICHILWMWKIVWYLRQVLYDLFRFSYLFYNHICFKSHILQVPNSKQISFESLHWKTVIYIVRVILE